MAQLYFRKARGYWEGRYIEPLTGQYKRVRLSKDKRSAERQFKIIIGKIEEGKDPLPKRKKRVKITEVVDYWKKYSEAHHTKGTFKRYSSSVHRMFQFIEERYPLIKYMDELTTRIFDEYKIWRRSQYITANGKPANNSTNPAKIAKTNTVNFELSTWNTIFERAQKWEFVPEEFKNPLKKVEKLKVTDAKPFRFLIKEEVVKLFDNTPNELKPVFALMIYAGLRRDEVRFLEWNDIDFKKKMIYIRMKGHRLEWNPKDNDQREIPIAPQLKIILKTIKKKKNNFVFSSNNKPYSYNLWRKRLINVTKKIKGMEDVTKLHSLRHTFASHLVMAGTDLPTVQSLMGHSDIKTTMLYSHLAPGHLKDAVKGLEF